MSFRLIARNADGTESTSSAMVSEEAALGFARDLIEDGITVLWIEDRDGAVVKTEDEVRAWCEARVRKRARPR